MVLITMTMGELVSAFPMSELACTTLRSSRSCMSWHAALPACKLPQQACCDHRMSPSEQACCAEIPQWRPQIALILCSCNEHC